MLTTFPIRAAIIGGDDKDSTLYLEASRCAQMLNMCRETDSRVFDARLFPSSAYALEQYLMPPHEGILVFITTDLLHRAKRLAKELAGRVRVVVMAGTPAPHEPVVMPTNHMGLTTGVPRLLRI